MFLCVVPVFLCSCVPVFLCFVCVEDPFTIKLNIGNRMNALSFCTLTFGDQAENHAGMQVLGELVSRGEGFSASDLLSYKSVFECLGARCELIPLSLSVGVEAGVEVPESAFVLVIRGGVDAAIGAGGASAMFAENMSLDLDKKAWMRGRVVNKHARWNVCFDVDAQEPDYEAKKGRIVAYDTVPATNSFREQLSILFGAKGANLKGEGNYYYDPSTCGIGFHGDSERRKVIGVRLAGPACAMPPLHFHWFYRSEAVGARHVVELTAGDIYLMSEKSVGTDWRLSSRYTVRHATGASKFTSILEKKSKNDVRKRARVVV